MKKFEGVAVPVGEEIHVFHPFNSAIYLHNEEYRGYDHIAREIDDSSVMYYWRLKQPAFDTMVKSLMSVEVQLVMGDTPSKLDQEVWEDTFGGEAVNFEGEL